MLLEILENIKNDKNHLPKYKKWILVNGWIVKISRQSALQKYREGLIEYDLKEHKRS